MSLDEEIRSRIVDVDSWDENYRHLKIQCRAKEQRRQHQEFGEALFEEMKLVQRDSDETSESFRSF